MTKSEFYFFLGFFTGIMFIALLDPVAVKSLFGL